MFGFNASTAANRVAHQMAPVVRPQRGMMPQVHFVPAKTGGQKFLTASAYGAFATAALTYGGFLIRHAFMEGGAWELAKAGHYTKGVSQGIWQSLGHTFGQAAKDVVMVPQKITKQIGEYIDKMRNK